MIPYPTIRKAAGPVNFFAHQVSSPLPRIESAREGLQPLVKLLTWYIEILDRKGSVAKHLHMPLFSRKIEDRINGLFSSTHPQVLGLVAGDSHCGVRPSWIDLIQEPIRKDQFEIGDDHKYRCTFGGSTVEMSKTDCDALSSELLRKLLQAPPEPEDVETEREARSLLIQDLTHLQEDISEINGSVQAILRTMQEQDPWGDRNSARAESSESSVETHICDVEAHTDPAIHSETRIEAEPIPERSLHGETGNDLAALGTSGANSHTSSVKAVSAWSLSEKRQYRTFLSTRGHLSWSRIAQEYEEIFHKGRSPSSLAGQARSLGLTVGRQRRKPGRPKRRDPLVLKVQFSSDSTERTTPTAPVQHPIGSSLGEENPRQSRDDDGYILQDVASSPEGNLSSPWVGPNLHSMAQSSTNEDHAKATQTDHELPGSFGLILN